MDYFDVTMARMEYEERVRSWQMERRATRLANSARKANLFRLGKLLVSLGNRLQRTYDPIQSPSTRTDLQLG